MRKTLAEAFEDLLSSQKEKVKQCSTCEKDFAELKGLRIKQPSDVLVIQLQRLVFNQATKRMEMCNDPIELGGNIQFKIDSGEILEYECIAAIQHKDSGHFQSLLKYRKAFYVVDGHNQMKHATRNDSINHALIFLFMKIPSY